MNKHLSSNDTIMMTDDLVDRVNIADLQVDPSSKNIEINQNLINSKFYDHDEISQKHNIGIAATISFEDNNVEIQGTLQLVSFGKDGWRIQLDNVDTKLSVKIFQVASQNSAIVKHVIIHDIVKLIQDIDITIHFGNLNETCTLSIVATQGHPI